MRPGIDRERLLALEACLAARERAGALRAIFHLDSQATARTLEQELELADAHCTSIGLEEMFIELVGGRG